jgi:hypothetical protein
MTAETSKSSLADFETLRRLLVVGATTATIAVLLFFAFTVAVTVPTLAKATDQAFLRFLAAWAPVPIYLWAIWQARTLFARLLPDREQAYLVLSRSLVRIGLALSMTSVFSGVVAFFLAIHSSEGGNARFISAVVPHIALCLIGLALAAVGVLLRRSGAVIAENETLKAKLEEFI